MIHLEGPPPCGLSVRRTDNERMKAPNPFGHRERKERTDSNGYIVEMSRGEKSIRTRETTDERLSDTDSIFVNERPQKAKETQTLHDAVQMSYSSGSRLASSANPQPPGC